MKLFRKNCFFFLNIKLFKFKFIFWDILKKTDIRDTEEAYHFFTSGLYCRLWKKRKSIQKLNNRISFILFDFTLEKDSIQSEEKIFQIWNFIFYESKISKISDRFSGENLCIRKYPRLNFHKWFFVAITG